MLLPTKLWHLTVTKKMFKMYTVVVVSVLTDRRCKRVESLGPNEIVLFCLQQSILWSHYYAKTNFSNSFINFSCIGGVVTEFSFKNSYIVRYAAFSFQQNFYKSLNDHPCSCNLLNVLKYIFSLFYFCKIFGCLTDAIFQLLCMHKLLIKNVFIVTVPD